VRNRLSPLALLLAVLVSALAGVPASAGAASTKDIYTDCTDGTLDGSYTAKQLSDANRGLEANTSEYAECSDAIYRAIVAQGGGSGSGSGSGGSNGSNGSNGSGTGGSTGSTGTSGTTGSTGTTSPSTGTSGTSGGTTPSTGGTTATTTPDRENDARDADATEKAAALAQATQAADAKAGAQAAELKDVGVPAAALELGESDATLPTPLLLTLVACVAAAVIAGGASGFQALRRRRGR
jgi:hypothetical protein